MTTKINRNQASFSASAAAPGLGKAILPDPTKIFTEGIKGELAKKRQGSRTDIVANLPPSSMGQARDKAEPGLGDAIEMD
jgi:hypothetical protein